MYYTSKKSFYIKQYGPKVLLIFSSILIVVLGVYIYYNSTHVNTSTEKKVVVAEQKATTEKVEEVVTTDTSGVLPKTLGTLRPLQKTAAAKVDSVTSDGKVVVNIENTKITVTLIGVDFKSSSSDVNTKMSDELKGKEIKLAFDKEKTNKDIIEAYLYIDDKLYNSSLIEKGYATYKKEKENTKLEDELLSAQAYAKQNQLGIWSNE